MDLSSTIGLKTCSLPLFHSEFLHFDLKAINLIFTKNISDISQKRPIGLLTLDFLPFVMAISTLTTVSGSTRFGLFVMKPNTQRLESMSPTSLSRVYTPRLRKREQHPSKEYLHYIAKVSGYSPHLKIVSTAVSGLIVRGSCAMKWNTPKISCPVCLLLFNFCIKVVIEFACNVRFWLQ